MKNRRRLLRRRTRTKSIVLKKDKFISAFRNERELLPRPTTCGQNEIPVGTRCPPMRFFTNGAATQVRHARPRQPLPLNRSQLQTPLQRRRLIDLQVRWAWLHRLGTRSWQRFRVRWVKGSLLILFWTISITERGVPEENRTTWSPYIISNSNYYLYPSIQPIQISATSAGIAPANQEEKLQSCWVYSRVQWMD